MGTIETTTAPTDVLATPAEAVAYAGVGDADDLQGALDTAHEVVDGPRSLTGRCFRRRTVAYSFSGWVPAGWARELPGGPEVQLLSVEYVSDAGATLTYTGATALAQRGDATLFGLDALPPHKAAGGKVTVNYTSGPGDADASTAAKRAVLDVALTLYSHPGVAVEEALSESRTWAQFLARWGVRGLLPGLASPFPWPRG